MCFVRVSGQTANIFLYKINLLTFITEAECVYCAVRNACLNKIWVNFRLQGRALDQAASSRPVNA